MMYLSSFPLRDTTLTRPRNHEKRSSASVHGRGSDVPTALRNAGCRIETRRFGEQPFQVIMPNLWFDMNTPKTPQCNPGIMKQVFEALVNAKEKTHLILPANHDILSQEDIRTLPYRTVKVPFKSDTLEMRVYTKPFTTEKGHTAPLHMVYHPTYFYQKGYAGQVTNEPEIHPIQAIRRQHMLFDRASYALMSELVRESPHTTLVIPHSFHSAFAANQLALEHPKTVKVMPFQADPMFKHHIPVASKEGHISLEDMHVSPAVVTHLAPQGLSVPEQLHVFSAGVFANPHHLETMQEDYHAASLPHVAQALADKAKAGNVFEIHHALPAVKHPLRSEHLKPPFASIESLFPEVKTLEALTLPQLHAFKHANKKALLTQVFPHGGYTDEKVQHTVVIHSTFRFVREKNALACLKAAEQLLSKHPHTCVIFAGPLEGKPEPWLKALHHLEQDFPNRFKYLGNLMPERITQIHAGSDISLHPSIREAFGVSTLEAMAMGNILCALPMTANRSILTKLPHAVLGVEPPKALSYEAIKQEHATYPSSPHTAMPMSQALARSIVNTLAQGAMLKPHERVVRQKQHMVYVDAYHTLDEITKAYQKHFTQIKKSLS
ncbi:MAG: glycosyltransferase [Vampirovibrionales bacterium]